MSNYDGVEFEGTIFLKVTYQWLEIPNISEGYEGDCWVNLKDIISIEPRKGGGAIVGMRGENRLLIKENPDEVMERLKKWNQTRN